MKHCTFLFAEIVFILLLFRRYCKRGRLSNDEKCWMMPAFFQYQPEFWLNSPVVFYAPVNLQTSSLIIHWLSDPLFNNIIFSFLFLISEYQMLNMQLVLSKISLKNIFCLLSVYSTKKRNLNFPCIYLFLLQTCLRRDVCMF